jgi:hypothetical protein
MNELVVAHYNGGLEWLVPFSGEFDRITVYDKGGQVWVPQGLAEAVRTLSLWGLPNVGREGHTMLSHIVGRYDDLAERTVFSQDGFSDKLGPEVFRRICRGEAVVNHRGPDMHWEQGIAEFFPTYRGVEMRACGMSQREWFDEFVGDGNDGKDGTDGVPVLPWINGSYVVGTAEEIRRRPREFYERILAGGLSGHVCPEEAFFLERLWYAMWKKPLWECTLVRCLVSGR